MLKTSWRSRDLVFSDVNYFRSSFSVNVLAFCYV